MQTAHETPWRNQDRIVFPVRGVSAYDDQHNRWKSRWGEPVVMATDAWPGGDSSVKSDDVCLTAALCRAAWSDLKGIDTAPKTIAWVSDAPTLVAVKPADATVEVAVDVAASLGLSLDGNTVRGSEIVKRGFTALLGLAGRFALTIHADSTEDADTRQRNGIDAVVDAFLALDANARHAIVETLRSPQIDSGHVFGQFLRTVTDEKRRAQWGEDARAWRRRWITWLIGQSRVDLPYDRDIVDEILLDPALDPDDARLALYQTIRGYDIDAEKANAERIGRSVAWSEQELIFGRMSRAFHNQALLFANARYVAITDEVATAATACVDAALTWPQLRPAADRLRTMMRAGRETPLTEMAGALDHLEEQALRHQRELSQAALEERRAQVERAESDPETDKRAGKRMDEIMRQVEAILRSAGDLRRALLNAPRRPAAYLIMSQRPSPTGAHLLAKLNEGEEPFLGKAANLRQLVPQGGDRVYASPDYSWLEYANHWIEAIPLFIKERIRVVDGVETAETVIDQEGMEESFRESMADPWARNLRHTEISGWCAIARLLLDDEADPRTADLGVQADAVRAWSVKEHGNADDVALLTAIIALAAESVAAAISASVERDPTSDRPSAARAILFGDTDALHPVWAATRAAVDKGKSWIDAAQKAVDSADDEARQRLDILRSDAKSLADIPRRPLPALHVLTTQSANMTDGYVRSWLEESIALYNIIDAHGLNDAVRERIQTYNREIETLGASLIDELGLGVEVDTIMATEGVSKSSAIRRIISANRTVQRQVALLAVLREVSGYSKADHVDPFPVDKYVEDHRDEIEAAALCDVIARNQREIEQAVAELRVKNPSASESELQRQVVQSDDDYRADLDTYVRFAAREAVLEAWERDHPDWKLRERWERWLRQHQRLALTTARKEIVAENGLNHLTLDPRFYYQATGGNKRFHLLYTPSRVDLGPRERESVETWAQWVGGRDTAAAQVGRRVYGLINKSVKRFDSLTEPEVLKTGENASMASHFAYSNAMALMVNATGRGDFEELGDQMSLREDRKIHPAGEGYGGYCVPKDGLFLEFVLTLTESVKLRQLGIEDRFHDAVSTLAARVLARRDDFATDLEWEAWAEKKIADQKGLRDLFELRDGYIPVFQITRLAAVLDELGQPPLREQRDVVKTLSARWGVHTMIAGAEHVNRFMPFYKAWLTYDALDQARNASKNGKLPDTRDAVIVLSAEYKPDTQDGRFSVGMRKYEIYTGTDDHLRYSLGSEASLIASLMIDGWDRTVRKRGTDDPELSKIARRWGLDATSDASKEKLRRVFSGHDAPGELRLVSPMGLSTQDVLRYTSDTRIENVADAVRAELNSAGLSDEDIDTNIRAFGPHLEKWARIRGTDAAQKLRDTIGGRIHALTLAVLGPDRSYEHALQGADVFDIGIAHKQVLALLDEPSRLVDLMLYGRPNSALVIVDGGSGARRRALSRLGVQRWFAAAERRGRTSWYRSIGLGENTIEAWREQMRTQRARAESIRGQWVNGNRDAAESAFIQLVETVRENQEALLALEEEERLVRFKRDSERDHLVTELLAEVARMESPSEFSFAHWLAIGGVFALEGASEKDIRRISDEFAAATQAKFNTKSSNRYGDRIFDIVRPMRRSEVVGFRQEGGVESSNKATEEVTRIAIDTRQELAKRARRMMMLRSRLTSFESELHRARRESWTTQSLVTAVRECLGTPNEFASEDSYGRVLALTRVLAERLIDEHYADEPTEASMLEERFRTMLDGRELLPEEVRLVSGGYEDIGAVGRLAQRVVERAEGSKWSDEERRARLDDIATLAEFLDTAQALETTLEYRRRDPNCVDDAELWRAIATFFAETLNDHFYEYRPWAYSRGVGFAEFHGDELYELADRHYRWLYQYLRNLITTRTEVRYLSVKQQDLLIGRIGEKEVAVAIGADGSSDVEERWRVYNQLREIAFIRNDGFSLPPVFGDFDPALIDADGRVNIIAMYPVGRTHVSRLLAEGPTLARELVTDGQPAANIILTRLPRVDENRIVIDDGHFYVDSDTYVAALKQHWGLNDTGAKALAERDAGPKGVRIAAQFSRPVTAAVILPMHGNPIYTSGETERLGLPYSVQSRFHTWTTYDKAKYPEIFAKTNVHIPDEIDWLAEWTEKNDDETRTLDEIRNGRKKTRFAGLAEFAKKHRIVMIKDAAESGGRGAKAFELRSAGGEIIESALNEATEFLYQISLKHNVAVQEVIISSPELWATEDFLNRFTDRQISEWRRPIARDRQPQTPLFGSFRVIMSTDKPTARDRRKHWHSSHPITLNSTQLITNVGRGGTLELLRPTDIHPEHREAILHALDEAGRDVMEAMTAFESRAAKHYEKETGDPVGADLTGVSYGIPRYLMLDFLLRPEFDRPGDLVEIMPDVDETGHRIGSQFLLSDGNESFIGKITGWTMILIEPNIGIGLWDRVALREIEHERERAREAGKPMDWNRVGRNARVVLRDLTRAGADYLAALAKTHGE